MNYNCPDKFVIMSHSNLFNKTNTSRNRYKRLDCPIIETDFLPFEEINKHLLINPIEPVFNRDGFYYDRLDKRCWIEYKDKAYQYGDPEDFLYSIRVVYLNKLMSKECMKSIKLLISEGLAPRELKQKYQDQCDYEEIRNSYRMAKKGAIRFRKKLLTKQSN